jgi:hypothetical protein
LWRLIFEEGERCVFERKWRHLTYLRPCKHKALSYGALITDDRPLRFASDSRSARSGEAKVSRRFPTLRHFDAIPKDSASELVAFHLGGESSALEYSDVIGKAFDFINMVRREENSRVCVRQVFR